MNQNTSPTSHDVAMHACYLMVGAEHAWKSNSARLDAFEGHMNLAALCVERAPTMAEFDNRKFAEVEDYPGVFYYEVTEELGAWLASNPHSNEKEFLDKCEEVFESFMRRGQPA